MTNETDFSQFANFLRVDTPMRFLVSVDQNYNVTFADDLTLDEAKEILRRWAIIGAKITKAQIEASHPQVESDSDFTYSMGRQGLKEPFSWPKFVASSAANRAASSASRFLRLSLQLIDCHIPKLKSNLINDILQLCRIRSVVGHRQCHWRAMCSDKGVCPNEKFCVCNCAGRCG